MKNYDVIIRGAYGAYNFGDDALLDVVYSNVVKNFPDSSIAIWGSQISYLKKSYPKATILNKADLPNVNCKHLIFGGGTQFYDFGQKRNIKSIIFLLFNPNYLFYKLRSILRNKKVNYIDAENEYYLCCGLGPFKSNSQIKKNALDRMSNSEFLYLRDMKSVDYCSEAKIESNLTVDMCFSKSITCQVTKNGKVAVILRDWSFSDSKYTIDKIYDEIKSIANYDVDIITFGKDPLTKRFASDNNMSLVSWDPELMTIDEFIKTLASYNIIISSRYHGIIYSILLNVPIIALPIENKLTQAAKELEGVVLADMSVNNLNYYIAQLNTDIINIEEKLLNTKNKNLSISSNTINQLFKAMSEK
jgi:polysaccharide pyruvyl transferase WcaK-like protein